VVHEAAEPWNLILTLHYINIQIAKTNPPHTQEYEMQIVVLFSIVLINIKWVINHNDFIKSSYMRHSLYAQLPLQVSAKPPNKLSTQSGYILSGIPDDIQARLICGLTQTHILAVVE
jgi:hypothetical protein